MQFAVPQFTDVEDKLIGPLTLKQFFVVLGAGGICLLFWSLPLPKVVAFIIDLPIAILGLTLAFASYNGRPMLSYIMPFIFYFISPKSMLFSREATAANVQIEAKPQVEETKEQILEAPDSRLRKLAYLLDKSTQNEKELINKTR
jgi:hypothetical protein